jgi:hypothetical protein
MADPASGPVGDPHRLDPIRDRPAGRPHPPDGVPGICLRREITPTAAAASGEQRDHPRGGLP